MGQNDFPSKALFRMGMGMNVDHVVVPPKSHKQSQESSKPKTRRVTRKTEATSNFPSKDFFLSGLGILSDDELSSNAELLKPHFQFDWDIRRATTFASKVDVAKQVIKWAVDKYGDRLVMSTSFGLQSAVLLHLVTEVKSGVPTLWVDTGYLPPETYKYAHYLKESLQLNLKICQSEISPAHMEALYGKLWESPDPSDRRLYGVLRKVIPMKTMMAQLNAKCQLAGLRKGQTDHRQNLSTFEEAKAGADDDCAKLYPLLNWTKEDVAQYFIENNLPQHPLYYKGYTTVGDAHSSRPKSSTDKSDRDTRFGSSGQQECGLHTEAGSVSDYKSLQAKSVKVALNDLTMSSRTMKLIDVEELIQNVYANEDKGFVIFGRVNCRFCRAAKLLLTSIGETYEDVMVLKPGEEVEDGASDDTKFVDLSVLVQCVNMNRRSGGGSVIEVRTVPQIFHRGKHVGGYTELCESIGETSQGQAHFLTQAEDSLKPPPPTTKQPRELSVDDISSGPSDSSDSGDERVSVDSTSSSNQE